MYNSFVISNVSWEYDSTQDKKEKIMNVLANDSCIGCGACESICDAVFSVEDRAVVKEAGIAGNEDCVKEAADACPVGAIEVA